MTTWRMRRPRMRRSNRVDSTLFTVPRFVANLDSWETRTKARKKPRKLPNPSRSRSPGADRKCLRPHRRNNLPKSRSQPCERLFAFRNFVLAHSLGISGAEGFVCPETTKPGNPRHPDQHEALPAP